MPYVESMAEFAARHGESIRVEDGPRWTTLFADGARIEGGDLRGVSIFEPPTDPSDLLRAKRRFIHTRLEVELRQYNFYLREVRDQAHYAAQYPESCPPPPPECEQCFVRGQQRIADLKQQLKKFDEQLADTPQQQGRAVHRQAVAERRREAEELGQRLQRYADPDFEPDAIEGLCTLVRQKIRTDEALASAVLSPRPAR